MTLAVDPARLPSVGACAGEADQRRTGEEADGRDEQEGPDRPRRHEGGHGPEDSPEVRAGAKAAVGDEGAARLAHATGPVRGGLAEGAGAARRGADARG